MSKQQEQFGVKVGLGLKSGILLLALALGANTTIQPAIGMVVPDGPEAFRMIVPDAPEVVPDAPESVPDAPEAFRMVVPDSPE